ncbi:hypothetical protein DES36_11865 [Alkalibaculum bacchi]|mgnify:FL=1|uniref:Uncharacterized protein n=1 Tax=Alkalibaculum bacchi TaxID=645887 RepID=A0A366HZH0_9FIRM|nr:GNAT family N-acetyltransferase [Alkalibaculum bacchi]RBP59714.1 hypothetical protein DES36_11865 [Alkalibaculum bacchi]
MSNYDFKKGNKCFYLGENEENPIAEITYKPTENGRVIIDHTYVSPQLRGKQIAKGLVDCVANYCREENLKVLPLCSYAQKLMKKNEEYTDILDIDNQR